MPSKRVFVCAFPCPECGKVVKVFKETEILVPAQKAEKKELYVAEKDAQTTLPA
jgi:hypothetical protein